MEYIYDVEKVPWDRILFEGCTALSYEKYVIIYCEICTRKFKQLPNYFEIVAYRVS
jgi:hypothetical protein